MRYRHLVVGIVLVSALLLTGCTSAEDISGTTKAEAMAMTLEEQYELAGERHQEFNEKFAEMQTAISPDGWIDGAASSEVVPMPGFSRGNDLIGDDRHNSYDFTITRWYPTDQPLLVAAQIADTWESHGWEVRRDRYESGKLNRVTVTTPDGYWFEAEPRSTSHRGTGVTVSSHTPVYWADSRAIGNAVAERRDAENDAGAPWDTTDRDENGDAPRAPGVFRPFPAWDTPHS